MGGEASAKREHPRYVVDVLIELETPAGLLLSGRSRNVSRGGFCVELPLAVAAGDPVRARIALIFHDQHMSEPLGLPARAVWSTQLGDGHQVGCKFSTLSNEQAAYLDLFLSYIDASPHPAGPASEE